MICMQHAPAPRALNTGHYWRRQFQRRKRGANAFCCRWREQQEFQIQQRAVRLLLLLEMKICCIACGRVALHCFSARKLQHWYEWWQKMQRLCVILQLRAWAFFHRQRHVREIHERAQLRPKQVHRKHRGPYVQGGRKKGFGVCRKGRQTRLFVNVLFFLATRFKIYF